MIRLKVFKKKDSIGFVSKGHANYKEYGKDIVCAAVSHLTYTVARSAIVNLNLQKSDYQLEEDEGYRKFVINRAPDEMTNLLFDTLVEGIKSLEEEGYDKFITLNLEEEKDV